MNSQPLGHEPSALNTGPWLLAIYSDNINWDNIIRDYINCDNINHDNIYCDNIKLDHITYFALSTECEPFGGFSVQACRPR